MSRGVVQPFAVARGEGLSVENPVGGQTTFGAFISILRGTTHTWENAGATPAWFSAAATTLDEHP